MALTNPQKGWIAQVRACAYITDVEYRALLSSIKPGAVSSTDERFNSCDDFELIMCGLERAINRAIANGLADPEEILGKVSDPWKFTRKRMQNAGGSRVNSYAPRRGKGDKPATEAQIAKIRAIQSDLTHYEPAFKDWSYIVTLLAHTKKVMPMPSRWEDLTTTSAKLLIDILQARYDQALTKADRQATAEQMRRSEPCLMDTPPDELPADVYRTLSDAEVDCSSPCPF